MIGSHWYFVNFLLFTIMFNLNRSWLGANFTAAVNPFFKVVAQEHDLVADSNSWNFRVPIQRPFRSSQKGCSLVDGQNIHTRVSSNAELFPVIDPASLPILQSRAGESRRSRESGGCREKHVHQLLPRWMTLQTFLSHLLQHHAVIAHEGDDGDRQGAMGGSFPKVPPPLVRHTLGRPPSDRS